MTENPEYIRETLKDLPEGVELISGAEMAAEFPGQVLDVGLLVREDGFCPRVRGPSRPIRGDCKAVT
jgi:hypothetical protein